jgi:hypothetical protein
MHPEALEAVMKTVLFLLEREQETTAISARPLHVQMERLHEDLSTHLTNLQREEGL